MPSQNIQCTNAPSKYVTCSTVKCKCVKNIVNVIRKNTVNIDAKFEEKLTCAIQIILIQNLKKN